MSTEIIHQLILNLNLTFCIDDIGLSKFGNIELEFSQNCFKVIIIYPVNPFMTEAVIIQKPVH